MQILIVDDNKDSVEFVARVLEESKYHTLQAYDGHSAVQIAKTTHPDLILLDVMMPDLDGITVCKMLTADPLTSSIPIIMVTARTELKDLETGLEAGAYDYIKKPFHLSELLARVRAALRLKKSQDELLDAKRRLEEMNDELAQLAITDSLTQVYNHTFLIDTLKFEIKRTERYAKSMAFLMIDIDFFKKVNDTYGHLIGDEVLREIVQLIKNPIRSIDVLGRYGGEEFGLILPETDESGAIILAEKIRKHIEDHTFIIKEDNKTISINLTVSIGVSIYPDDNIKDVISLIRSADNALYISKKEGRNKVFKVKK